MIGKVDILSITETKFSESFPSNLFSINSFPQPVRLDRNRNGDGIINMLGKIYLQKNLNSLACLTWYRENFCRSITAQKMKFSIKDFFSKCDKIRSFLRIWSHLLKEFLMGNFISYALCTVISPIGNKPI